MQPEQERDVSLILKDGKEIRMSSNELSAVSDFFSTLQNTDMKERIEGIIRLEHVYENVMRDVLEFTRSGSVCITHEYHAKDLIEAADYFLLPSLKRAAGRLLEQTLRPSNCISIHHFAERYQCEDLVFTSREFIFSNFAAVAESQEFLHLESQQVEDWICRDEISVSSEAIVFRIILKWIEQGKSERRGKFEELFRHVRLSFVSSGYLKKYVVTNNFVKENSSCYERVKDALKGIFPESEDRQQSFRNWSDSHLVIFTGKETLCYDPVKDNWYQLSDAPIPYSGARINDVDFLCPREEIPGSLQWLETWQRNISRFHPFQMTSYQGKLYVMPMSSIQYRFDLYRHIHYDSSLNSWGIWPWRERKMVSLERSALTVVGQHIYSVNTNPKSISKYNASSNTWNIVSSGAETAFIDEGICAVPMGNYLYVLGGSFTRRQARRFDTLENKWVQIADMNEERINACGVAAHGKIFVAGGCMVSCEMYNVSSNEWREMASLNIPRAGASMVRVNGLLYIVGGAYPFHSFAATLESYDIETNMWTTWKKETKIPISNLVCPMEGLQILKACSLNIRKDLLPKPISRRGKGLLASLWYEMKLFFPQYTNHKQPRPRPWIGQI